MDLSSQALFVTTVEIPSQYVPDDQETELGAIRALVATVERVQQQELVDEFVFLFREDAIWTTGHGRRLFGRDVIAMLLRTDIAHSEQSTVCPWQPILIIPSGQQVPCDLVHSAH